MNLGLISVRYAKALLDFSGAEQADEQVYQEALNFVRVVESIKNFRRYMENPVLSLAEKKKLILNATDKNPSIPFQKFADLVLKNGRESQFHEIMLKFIELYRDKKNIHFGRLITATQANKETEESISGLMSKKLGGTFKLENIVDPNLLGGFIFEIDDLRLNASLSHQLNQITKEFIDKNQSFQ